MNLKIGIIGAGVMGTGVAERFARYGYEIVLIDIKDEIIKKSKDNILRNLFVYNMMHTEKIKVDDVINRISFSTQYVELKEVDILIENIPEIIDLKVSLYEKLKEYCKPNCLLWVNTSCVPITMIGEHTLTPDKVIGVHFMNPVPMQRFAEVIKGKLTSEDTVNAIIKLLSSVEINCTVIHDNPGFVSNRLSHLFMNEAANLVYEGVAEPEQIDMIFEQGFHHETGPLHTADLIGIDTVANSLDVLYEFYKDDRFKCSPYIREMVSSGKLGRKTDEGFFKYN